MEEFLAMFAAELLALLVAALVKAVFGLEMPRPRLYLAA